MVRILTTSSLALHSVTFNSMPRPTRQARSSIRPDSGTILNLGDSQTLMVQFTPDDTVNYATTVASVSINVVEQSDLGDAARFLRDLAVE